MTTNPHDLSRSSPLTDLITERLNRRALLKLAGAAGVAPMLPGCADNAEGFAFQEIAAGFDDKHHVAPGYAADVLIRWGDPVVPGAPPFDPQAQTPEGQSKQFGYNNDFIGFFPLPRGSAASDHGLLGVNHEDTVAVLMFPDPNALAPAACLELEKSAHGLSVVEVKKSEGGWRVIADSQYARRITPLGDVFNISGPAAGHERLRTSADPQGRTVIGTLGNCSGGMTPWGTYLTAEENVHYYFSGDLSRRPDVAKYRRYGVPSAARGWGYVEDRFNVEREPNEPHRFGWIVEVDPYDPKSVPVKRTALGRFCHEGAECIVNKDGRIVVYSADDTRFEYVYRFVTARPFNQSDAAANRDLLDDGVLSVARFDADGTLHWLPLVFGTGKLVPENGFHNQGDVVIDCRFAAEAVGATPMDRPEGIVYSTKTRRLYASFTLNPDRTQERIDPANPRANNASGHILELTPPGEDHAAASFKWDVLVLCGPPNDAAVGARWGTGTTANGWFANPDNLAIDSGGRLWVATDGNTPGTTGRCDGLWALGTDGAGRGRGRGFFRCPVGAELTGPRFTPDGRTLFVSVQHPAFEGAKSLPGFERVSTFDDPATRWPDFEPDMPPRPAIVVITKNDGGVIGS